MSGVDLHLYNIGLCIYNNIDKSSLMKKAAIEIFEEMERKIKMIPTP